MKPHLRVAALAAFAAMGASRAPGQISITTVPVANPGNAADPFTGYGAVTYAYNIGTKEVTNAQYAAFLNAVAATDTNELFSPGMAGTFGGIRRLNSAGSYTYETVASRADNPVNYVSFWDAARFANWLHNGQPTGLQNSSTTEDGAYTLTPGGNGGNTTTRNAGWQWAVCSENEWYKAAYHQPAGQGGDSDSYWLYPTSRNTIATADANYSSGLLSPLPVGSYSANFYGAFDMGGNVWEWNDAIYTESARGLRGGGFDDNFDFGLLSASRYGTGSTVERSDIGFRVSQVPGPTSSALLAISCLATARRRRR